MAEKKSSEQDIAPSAFDEEAERIAATIIDLTRSLTRTTPTPRGNPYFGLDAIDPRATSLLDRLATAGIFRKYEHVLELGAGLGGAARWLALCRGCRVVGVTPTLPEAAGARALTRRANLSGQVEMIVARSSTLPLRSDRFTHVWSVGALASLKNPVPTLREAFRTVRPGGLFSALEYTRMHGQSPTGTSHRPIRAIDAYVEALTAAGFVNVRTEDVTMSPMEIPLTVEKARAALATRIETSIDRRCAYLRKLDSSAVLPERSFELHHITATRP